MLGKGVTTFGCQSIRLLAWFCEEYRINYLLIEQRCLGCVYCQIDSIRSLLYLSMELLRKAFNLYELFQKVCPDV